MSETYVNPEFDREVPTGQAVEIKEPPARLRLEQGTVQVEIAELTVGLTSRQSLYQVAATFKVVEPAEFAGANIWENFVIGDQEDPQALKAETWGRSIGGSRFRKCADKTQVPFGKMSTMTAQMTGKPVVVDMYTFVEPAKNKDGSDNAYAGKLRRRIRDFYRVGERPLKATGKEYTGTEGGGVAAATVPINPNESQTCPVPGCGKVLPAAEMVAHMNSHD